MNFWQKLQLAIGLISTFGAEIAQVEAGQPATGSFKTYVGKQHVEVDVAAQIVAPAGGAPPSASVSLVQPKLLGGIGLALHIAEEIGVDLAELAAGQPVAVPPFTVSIAQHPIQFSVTVKPI